MKNTLQRAALALFLFTTATLFGAFTVTGGTGADMTVFDTNIGTWLTYYVDPVNGDDVNTGLSKASAVRSFEVGCEKGQTARQSGNSARVILMDGYYRACDGTLSGSANTYAYIQGNELADPGTALLIEAENEHQAIITGAEKVSNWTSLGGNVYKQNSFTYLGTNNCYIGGIYYLDYLGTRRELVLIGNTLLMQVATTAEADSTPGTFYAAEGGGELRIHVPTGEMWSDVAQVSMGPQGGKALVEIRNAGRNVGFRGIVVEMASLETASGGSTATTALWLANMTNTLQDNCIFRYNGWNAFYMGRANGSITNGTFYWNGWKAGGCPDDGIIVDCVAMYNNWRGGLLGNVFTWDAACYKALDGAQHTYRNLICYSNWCHGIWEDTACTNILIENCVFFDNRASDPSGDVFGIYHEKSQGPMLITNCSFTNNNVGIQLAGSFNTMIYDSTFMSNDAGNISLDIRQTFYSAGSYDHLPTDTYFNCPSNISLYHSTLIGDKAIEVAYHSAEERTNYVNSFLATYKGDYNVYGSEGELAIFRRVHTNKPGYAYEPIFTTFWDWQTYSKQETNSMWLYPATTPDISNDLVAHWTFNASGNLGDDSSSANNDLSVGGSGTAPAYDASGVFGGAVRLEGGQYFYTADDASLNPGTEITFAYWVKLDATWGSANDIYFVEKNPEYFIRANGSDTVMLTRLRDTSTGWITWRESYARTVTEWHHYAVTYDGSEVRIYVDGVLEAMEEGTGALEDTTANMNIGKNVVGYMDDVRVYSRALDEEEIHLLVRPVNVTLVSPTNNAETNVTSPTFEWTQVAGYTGEAYQLGLTTNGVLRYYTSAPDASSYTLPFNLEEGTYTWKVRLYDDYGAGFWSEERTLSITPAPDVTPSHASLSTNAAFTLTLSVNHDSGYWSTNGIAGTYYAFPSATGTNLLLSNTVTVYYYGFDGAFYSETNSNTYTFDTTAPTVATLATPTNGEMMTTMMPTLSWGASTDASGVADYVLYVMGEAYTNVAGTNVTFPTNVTEGIYTYSVVARDAAGNESAVSEERVFAVVSNETDLLLSSVTPAEDTHVMGGVNYNTSYGTSATLSVKDTDGNDDSAFTFISFDLSVLPLSYFKDATLRLYTPSGQGTNTITAATNVSWDEDTLTWNNRPLTSQTIASNALPSEGYVTIDVSSYLNDVFPKGATNVTFMIEEDAALLTTYASKETANVMRRPTLFVNGYTYSAVPTIRVSHPSLITNESFTLTLSLDFATGYYSTNGAAGPYYAFTPAGAAILMTNTVTTIHYFASNVSAVGETNSNMYVILDGTPPSEPRGVVASATENGNVRITWDANGEVDLLGYHVYRSTISNYTLTEDRRIASYTTNTFYDDDRVQARREYYYVVSAVDLASNESLSSVSYVVVPEYTYDFVGLHEDDSVFFSSEKESVKFGIHTGGTGKKYVTLRIATLSGALVDEMKVISYDDYIVWDKNDRGVTLRMAVYIYSITIVEGGEEARKSGVLIPLY